MPTTPTATEKMAQAAPAVAATVVDTVDELIARAADRGVDVEAALRNSGEIALALARLLSAPEFRASMVADLLCPANVSAVNAVGSALAATHQAPPSKAGILAIVRATRDPDVQRALGFGLAFLKNLGRQLAGPERAEDDDE
ncbi:MAG: DUF1641 domain-containing protein [Myxococcota bacterium]